MCSKKFFVFSTLDVCACSINGKCDRRTFGNCRKISPRLTEKKNMKNIWPIKCQPWIGSIYSHSTHHPVEHLKANVINIIFRGFPTKSMANDQWKRQKKKLCLVVVINGISLISCCLLLLITIYCLCPTVYFTCQFQQENKKF